MDLELIKKYNVQGPRYTSYPTAVQFHEINDQQVVELHDYLLQRNSNPHPISLYFHIPFCFSLCWYCGCTKVITKDADRGDVYLAYLEKEMDQKAALIHPDSKVVQVHFGGGTPTFLRPYQIRRLGVMIHEHFNLSQDTEFGVEIDPRRCTYGHIKALVEIGCNRASLGVQDTNEEVQEAIHRIQPFGQTKQVTKWLHEAGVNSINFDLIYGLPKQSQSTFRQTMDDILRLSPDRLAVYSYAHIPTIMPAQKLLNTDDIPSTDEKLAMLKSSITYFSQNGYRFIGMDHFSKEGEELANAMDEGTLQRNFQGYSTLAGADLYAFGMSGISNVGQYYWQNTKSLEEYYQHLDSQRAPVAKVLRLTTDDQFRKEVIMQIMCCREIDFEWISRKWNINVAEYFEKELECLEEFQRDGLVIRTSEKVQITKHGRLFLRNIAMCFDKYFASGNSNRKFSKTI